MSRRELRGLAGAAGVALAPALAAREPAPPRAGSGGAVEQERVGLALAAVAADLGRSAERLAHEGLLDEAAIVETNRLMAEDPALAGEASALAAGCSAEEAIAAAGERHAAALASIGDPLLAARASDVRELVRRALRFLAGTPPLGGATEPFVLVALDLGPADVAELKLAGTAVRGIGLAEGSATSHAAIMARALGIPLVVGLGAEWLAVETGTELLLDGDRGLAVLSPAPAERDAALRRARQQSRSRARLARGRGLAAETRDGRRILLLCNAATAAEVEHGLGLGADGIGLLRTELAFLDAPGWPGEREHESVLRAALAPAAGRIATVRTLDFGADKTPPFLSGVSERGLALSLAYPDALAAQLRAIAAAGSDTRLRVMFPLVESAEQLRRARTLARRAFQDAGWAGPPPQVGAMIETPAAACRAPEIALEADFLSIGTNDLVQYTLGLDRERPLAAVADAAHPAVLSLIGKVVAAAERAGISVEVCGEAAGEPPVAALLVGLGVSELSVSPARLDELRATVRGVSAREAATAAAAACAAETAEQALALGRALCSGELGDEHGEVVGSGRGSVT